MFSLVISSPVSSIRGAPAVPFARDWGGIDSFVAVCALPLVGELLLLVAMLADVTNSNQQDASRREMIWGLNLF